MKVLHEEAEKEQNVKKNGQRVQEKYRCNIREVYNTGSKGKKVKIQKMIADESDVLTLKIYSCQVCRIQNQLNNKS